MAVVDFINDVSKAIDDDMNTVGIYQKLLEVYLRNDSKII